MVSFWPTFNLVGSTPGFAASSALSVTPFFLAILPSVSPLTTTYSVPAVFRPRAAAHRRTGGGGTTGGLEATMGGGFVSMASVLVSTGGVVLFADLFAFAALDEHGGQAGDADGEHAEARRVSCANGVCFAAPAGSLVGRMDSDCSLIWRGWRPFFEVVLICFAAKFSLGKFRGVLNSFGSLARAGNRR